MSVEGKVVVIRGVQVLIDRDLAELYGVETRDIDAEKWRLGEGNERYYAI